MSWEHAKGPLIFSHNEDWQDENGFDTLKSLNTVAKLRENFTAEIFTDRERDHYYGHGEIYDNAEGTRKVILGL